MKVHSHSSYVYRCCGINVMPGINHIDSKAFFEHPSVKARIEKGILELLESPPKMVEATAYRTEEQMNKDENVNGDQSTKILLKEIKDIYDHDQLKTIIEQDDRSKVVDAAKKQLAKIKEEA